MGIWHITESPEELMNAVEKAGIDIAQATAFRSTVRKAQWAAVRLLFCQFPQYSGTDIYYDEYGKPHLTGEKSHISISHSRQMAGIIIDSVHPTGIDIEFLSSKVKTIRHKFLSDAEQAFVDPHHDAEHLMTLWCAKEALYKTHGKKKLSFKENIAIAPFPYCENGEITGTITTAESFEKFSMWYEKKGEYMLVYLLNN